MTTIVLADDHIIVRQSLRLMLEAQADFQVIGEASTGLETIELIERLKPDVLVVDMMMPELSGLEVTHQVKRRFPKTVIVILSMHENEAYVIGALQAGASAYVLKKSTGQELIDAINQGIQGHLYLSPPLSERAIKTYVEKAHSSSLDPYETLTNREREVLSLAAEGLNNSQIASKLSISPRTVEMHHGNLMRKLRLRTQTDLIRYAIQRGIVPLES